MILSFLLPAFTAALLASFSGGVMGSYIVVKRLANLCGSITHSVLGGMGLFLYLKRVHGIGWCDPLLGAFFAALLSAGIVGWIHLRFRQRVDAIIAAVWSTGMALGIIFLALTPGSTAELTNFLLGNLLWISPGDLFWLSLLNGFILCVVYYCYRSFLIVCFDEEQALLQRVPLQTITLLLFTLVALTIVLLIQMIGTVLTIALLTLPATTANLFTQRLKGVMIGAIFFSALSSCSGILLSYFLDWPPGATISLVAALIYCIALNGKSIHHVRHNTWSPPPLQEQDQHTAWRASCSRPRTSLAPSVFRRSP